MSDDYYEFDDGTFDDNILADGFDLFHEEQADIETESTDVNEDGESEPDVFNEPFDESPLPHESLEAEDVSEMKSIGETSQRGSGISFGSRGCSDCSGSCWQTCSGSCEYHYGTGQ